MIRFLVCARFRYTLDEYFAGWGQGLRDRVEIIQYESLGRTRPWPVGTYVFTDLERLIKPEMRAACKLAERMHARPDAYRVLNDPRRVLGRFRLLSELHAQQLNGFNIHRIGTPTDRIRFPVFLKRDYEHSARGIRLLNDAGELSHALRRLGPLDRLRRHRLMITEYCDVSDDQGRYQKYSAMRLGQCIVPRHILLSDRWLTKKPDLITEEVCGHERRFVETGRPHDGVSKAFDIAGIDYGRIDYGLRNGKAQVWEINTNPRLVPARDRIDPKRLDAQTQSAGQVNDALKTLAQPMRGEPIEVRADELGLWRGPLKRLAYRAYASQVRS